MSQVDTVNHELINALQKGGRANGIDLDTPIRAGGKTYTIGELVKNAEQVESLQKDIADLKAFQETVLPLFRGHMKPEDRDKSLRAAMARAGADADKIEAHIAELHAREEAARNPKPPTKAAPAKPAPEDEEGAEGEEETVDPIENHPVVQELRQQIQHMRSQSAAVRNKQIDEVLSLSVKKQFDNNVELRKLMEAAGRLHGGDTTKIDKTAEVIRDRALRTAKRALEDTIRSTGKPLTDEVIEKAIQDSIEDSVGLVKSTLGDVEHIGPTTTVSLESLRDSVQKTKPLAPPDPSTVTADTAEEALLSFLEDDIQRDAFRMAGGSRA